LLLVAGVVVDLLVQAVEREVIVHLLAHPVAGHLPKQRYL